MTGFLRTIRGICGFLAAANAVSILGSISTAPASAAIGVLGLLIFGGAFFFLRAPINSLHAKTGAVAPLLSSQWAL